MMEFGRGKRKTVYMLSTPASLTLEDKSDRVSRNVGNYQSTLRGIPEERRFRLHRSGSLIVFNLCF
jgi:hypothetical protein